MFYILLGVIVFVLIFAFLVDEKRLTQGKIFKLSDERKKAYRQYKLSKCVDDHQKYLVLAHKYERQLQEQERVLDPLHKSKRKKRSGKWANNFFGKWSGGGRNKNRRR